MGLLSRFADRLAPDRNKLLGCAEGAIMAKFRLRFCHSSRSRRRTRIRHAAGVASAIALGATFVIGTPVAVTALAVSGPLLMADNGQFVSVPVFRALDTRNGTGGVPAQPIAAGGTVTFPVNVGDVADDATAVVLSVSAINATTKGFLTVYNSDSADPGVASVGLRAVDTNQTATVPVSSTGEISVTNHSGGTVDVVGSVTGYYTSATADYPGDTYSGVQWASIADTTTGLNVPQAKVAAGGSLTFQVSGLGGIPAGADTAVLQINAINAGTTGYLTAYAAGDTDPNVALLNYNSDTVYRNMMYVPVSASGQATVTNHGAAPVDVSVFARGYYIAPDATPAGAESQSSDPQLVFGTATSGTTLAANASATFQVTGRGSIPASGVTEVTEDVVVTNPTAQGRVDEGPAGGQMHAVVSYLNADSAMVGYDNGLLSAVSPSGQETITNVSSGTVDIQVAITGWFRAPAAPAAPDPVTVSVSGTSATISWSAVTGDGGSPVTGYTVTSSPDPGSVTVDPSTFSATLSGLPNAASDAFTVTAANAAGTGTATGISAIPITNPPASSPLTAGVSLTVLDAGGVTPMANATVGVFYTPPADLEVADGTTFSLTELASGSTNGSGVFTAAVPATAVPSSDMADIGDGTTDAFNADIVAIDSAGNVYEDDAVLIVGQTVSDQVTADPGMAIAGVTAGQITSQTPISVTDTPDSSGTYRYVPVAPVNSGYGEQVTFNYNPTTSKTRQTMVDVAVSSPIGNTSLSWHQGTDHIEEMGRSTSTPWTKAGSYHYWVWANYNFHRHKICVQPLHQPQICRYHWRVHHFQGQLDDSNPNGCKKHHPDFCAPIGGVPYNVPKFTPGNTSGCPACHNYAVVLSSANSPWSRQNVRRTQNTAAGNFYLPFGGNIGVSSTDEYGKITTISYTWISSGNCGSGHDRVIWGYKDDPVHSRVVQGNCVTDQQLFG
jgi:hypothetical protein